MPNYDPDYTSVGLRLVNTGFTPNDPTADSVLQLSTKTNENTLLLDQKVALLESLNASLANLLAGNPTFTGTCTTAQLAVQNSFLCESLASFSSRINVAGEALFGSDVTFERVVYMNGLILVPDLDTTDDSGLAVNSRWVNNRISKVIETLEGVSLEDLESFAKLDSPQFEGIVKAPTPEVDAPLDDRVPTLSWVDSYLAEKLEGYAALVGGSRFQEANIATPPAGIDNERIVNAFWVNEAIAQQIGTVNDSLVGVGASITSFQSTVGSLTEDVQDLQKVELLGSIVLATRSSASVGWLEANGQEVPETQYPQYFALVGHNFDTSTPTVGNFQLPDWSDEVSRVRTLLGLPVGAPLKAFVFIGDAVTAPN